MPRLSDMGRLAKSVVPPAIRVYLREAWKFGVPAASGLRRAHALVGEGQAPTATRSLRLRGYPHPIYFRPGTSDCLAIRQVLTYEDYGRFDLGDPSRPQLVIDCGANAGYASVFFLTRFPGACVVAVEPDAGNFEICRRNLEPFGDRVTLVQAAVWPRDEGLRVERGGYRDGREWSHRVRPCRGDEPADIRGVSPGGLLADSEFDRIGILKVDIERSEAELFAEGCDEWVARTDNILIELHDAECESVFFRALEGYCYRLDRAGELTFCRDLRPPAEQVAGPPEIP